MPSKPNVIDCQPVVSPPAANCAVPEVTSSGRGGSLEVRPPEAPEGAEVRDTPDPFDAAGTSAEAVCVLIDQAVAFTLAGQRYALPVGDVQEIQHIVAFAGTTVDGPVIGIVNLRGDIVPAVDLRRVLGLTQAPFTIETPMVICRSATGLVALLVDEVDDVLLLDEGCVQPTPPLHALASKMRGVARLASGLVYLLDLEAVLDGVTEEGLSHAS